MRYLGYEVCLLACRIAGVPDRQCNAFHRAQTCQPEGDSRSGFLPAGLPSFPVPRRAQRLLVFSFDYSACGQPIASSDLAAYCSASSARAEFLQRVRRLLTGGSLRPGARARRQPPRITIPRRGFATAPSFVFLPTTVTFWQCPKFCETSISRFMTTFAAIIKQDKVFCQYGKKESSAAIGGCRKDFTRNETITIF